MTAAGSRRTSAARGGAARSLAWLLLLGGSALLGWALVCGLLTGAAWLATLSLWSSLLGVAELLGALGAGLVLLAGLLDRMLRLAKWQAGRGLARLVGHPAVGGAATGTSGERAYLENVIDAAERFTRPAHYSRAGPSSPKADGRRSLASRRVRAYRAGRPAGARSTRPAARGTAPGVSP